MKVALGQFAVSREWQDNAETCIRLMKQVEAGGADLLVLPEGILARDIADPAFAQNAPAGEIPQQKVNEELRAKLPEEIGSANKMISVNSGSFPPCEIVTDTRTMTGASADMTDAIGQMLGVKVEHATVSGLSALLSGIKSGRYQFSMGPVGDFKSRQEANDFVDWVQEYVVFAVHKGNPKGIDSLDDACGQRIAVQAGGSAEKAIKAQAEKCAADGRCLAGPEHRLDDPWRVRQRRGDYERDHVAHSRPEGAAPPDGGRAHGILMTVAMIGT